MREKRNKIFWRVGLEITPDTFIHADNYNCNQYNLIRRLIARENFGLLPMGEMGATPFVVRAGLNNREVCLEQLVCCGATEAGYLVLFDDERLAALPKKQVTIPNVGAAFYVVLRINPYEQVLIEPVDYEEAPEASSAYELCVRELGKIAADELAVVKVLNNGYSTVIDADYIPPCMSVNACSKLSEVFVSFKKLFTEIRSIIEQKKDQFGKLMYPLTLLHCELDDFSPSDTPKALVGLIKKFIMTYQFFIPDIRQIAVPDAQRAYNHNDVALIFKSLLSYLQEVKLIVGKVEMIEEDFTPQI